jgi:hypothetical protein
MEDCVIVIMTNSSMGDEIITETSQVLQCHGKFFLATPIPHPGLKYHGYTASSIYHHQSFFFACKSLGF